MLDTQNGLDPWALTLLTFAIVLAAVEIGYRVGRRQRARTKHDSESVASVLTTASMGLVAVMLAFTFGWAATRFDLRRTTRVDEAQAIGRVFHFAEVLPRAQRDTVRECVRNSLEMRDAASVERAFRQRAALLDASP